jgi:hypothetical protein
MEIEIKWPEQAQRKSSGKAPKQSSPKPPKKKSREFPLKKALAVAGVGAAIVLAIVLLGRERTIFPAQPPEKVAAGILTALSSGDQEDFMKHVDVGAFACFMDPTGLTRRDYAQADSARKQELELMHAQLLADDLFNTANQGKRFEITGELLKDASATINVKPWIQFGNKLYKCLTFETKGKEWKLTGLASPDI